MYRRAARARTNVGSTAQPLRSHSRTAAAADPASAAAPQVVHVGFSLNYGELITRIQKSKVLREKHTNHCLVLLELMGMLAHKDKIIRARQRARASLRAVEENNRSIKQLMRERYTCTPVTATLVSEYGLKDTGSEYTPTDTAS